MFSSHISAVFLSIMTPSERKRLLIEALRLKLHRIRQMRVLDYIRRSSIEEPYRPNVLLLISERRTREALQQAETSRYSPGARITYREGHFAEACDNFLYSTWLNEFEFRKMFAMERANFWKLHDLIRVHPVFTKSPKGRPQAKPAHQLMVLLAYLRTEGNGMSNDAARNIFFASSGGIQIMRQRCLIAIYDCLLTYAIFWPDAIEQKVIQKSFFEDYQIPNVTAILDGTLFGLAFTPQREDASDFKGRKGYYTLTCLIANDHRRRIRYYHLGWPGSTHDDRVLANSWLEKNSSLAFGDTGLALGDCAYAPRDWLVPAFKKPAGGDLSAGKTAFNTLISKPRVSSEHTIGILKGRFPVLRSIRMRLTTDITSMAKIQQLVAVCIILHNLLIGWDDNDWILDDDNDDASVATQLDESNELNQPIIDGSMNDARRNQLFSYFMECIYA